MRSSARRSSTRSATTATRTSRWWGFPGDVRQFLLRARPSSTSSRSRVGTDGFIATYRTGNGKVGWKMFNFQPGVTNVLYVKAGWETMACVKPLDLFLKECTFGEELTGQYMLDTDKPSLPQGRLATATYLA